MVTAVLFATLVFPACPGRMPPAIIEPPVSIAGRRSTSGRRGKKEWD